ncbi:hypothetical protein NDN08_005132 [Rhodosorus marinus]|uniref:ER membrane protein complex subunit 1 n=1 Tax=Rhodosorus marinus TaxID=101924 RepID=A0AAV8V416_9RHOD|nr:hypothetical protein NDN08_005132 [Rhodosorus marinus]
MAKLVLQNFLLILVACVIGRVAQWFSSLDAQVLSIAQVAHLHGDESLGGFVLLNDSEYVICEKDSIVYIGPNGERRETSLVRKGHHGSSGRVAIAVDANRLHSTLRMAILTDGWRLILFKDQLTTVWEADVLGDEIDKAQINPPSESSVLIMESSVIIVGAVSLEGRETATYASFSLLDGNLQWRRRESKLDFESIYKEREKAENQDLIWRVSDDHHIAPNAYREQALRSLPHLWIDPWDTKLIPTKFNVELESRNTNDVIVFHWSRGVEIFHPETGTPVTELLLEPNMGHADYTLDGSIESLAVAEDEKKSCTVALGTRVSLVYKKSLCHRSEGYESTVALVYPVVSATQDTDLLPRKRAILIFDNIVYCIDTISGRLIWKNELPVEVGSRSNFQEKHRYRTIFVEPLKDASGSIYRIALVGGGEVDFIDAGSGRTVLFTSLSFSASTPPIAIDVDGDGVEDGVLVRSGAFLYKVSCSSRSNNATLTVAEFCTSACIIVAAIICVMLTRAKKSAPKNE